MGEAVINCHGIRLLPADAEPADEKHRVSAELIEDEYYVRIEHEMTKTHYISFIAGLTPDGIQMVKLYPEGPAECRLKRRGLKKILFYCNRDGLFSAAV